MNIKYTIEAYNKNDDFLVFEIEIDRAYLKEIQFIMIWNNVDYEGFIYRGWGFNLSIEQINKIGSLLGYQFNSDLYNFQLGSGITTE